MFRAIQFFIFPLILLTLFACTTPSPRQVSELLQGQRYFNSALYKPAFRVLLPLAADGNAQAQYAIGYMYYYGYGVNQDIDAGYFWILRAAHQHYKPAIAALDLIAKQKNTLVTGTKNTNQLGS